MAVTKTKQGYKLVKSLFGKYEEIPEEWEQVFLKNVIQIKGRVGWKGYTQEDFVEEGNGAISLGANNISKNNQLSLENITYVKWEKYDESPEIHVSEGDIIVAQRGSIGKIALIDQDLGKTTINPNVVLLTKSKTNNLFLFYALTSNYIKKQMNSIVSSTTIPLITQGQINHFKLLIPQKLEQQKIASILSNVDALVSSYDEIIQKTKVLKKGMMQQLLTKGIGHTKFKKVQFGLRYDQGEIPNDWEVKTTGKICKSIVSGRNKPTSFDGHIPWLTVDDFEGIYVNSSKKNLKVTKEELKKCSGKIVPPNSVLMSCVGDLGLIAINQIEVSMNQQLHAFVCSDIIEPYFLALTLVTKRDYMKAIATTTTVPYMNKNSCESIPIQVPSIHEQRKIISILREFHNRTQSLEERKSHLESLKKGLMQKLLTGKIRVKA